MFCIDIFCIFNPFRAGMEMQAINKADNLKSASWCPASQTAIHDHKIVAGIRTEIDKLSFPLVLEGFLPLMFIFSIKRWCIHIKPM